MKLLENGSFVPDLAIVDLNMPHKDGLSLIADLAGRAEYRFPKIVLTSSIVRSDLIRSRLCADLVLTKPDTARELEIVLRGAINTI
jgi:DNA-binding response OmpR family regulator